MWTTKLTDALNIKYPIIQGPFGGGFSSVQLAAAVSNLGGLGSFGAHSLTPGEIIETNNAIRALTDKPYAINLWISDRDEGVSAFNEAEFEKVKKLFKPYFDELSIDMPEMPPDPGSKYAEQIQAILQAKPPVFSFVYGIPSEEVLEACRRFDITTIGTATTVDEAVALEKAGVDVVVATGFEAGGHRVSFLRSPEESLMGTFSLTPQVADNISIPVVAAGGIADGRGIAAALTLGAHGVQIGTAFLACADSGASDVHKEKLFSPEAKYTTLTKAFTGRLARGLSSKMAIDLKAHEKHFAPYPLQGTFLGPLRTAALARNRLDLFSVWAGQSASLLKHTKTEALFSSLIEQTEEVMRSRATG